MLRRRTTAATLAVATALLLTSTGAATAVPAPAPTLAQPAMIASPPAAEHVVLLALDGFDEDYLDGRADLRNIRALARRGALTTGTGVMSSVTNQSWTSVATGAYPETHRNAAYYFDPVAGVGRGQSRDSAVEGLGQSLRAQGRTIASVQWFMLQGKGVEYGDPSGLYTQPGGDCTRRADDAEAILEGRPVDSGGTPVTVPEVPDLLVLYCDDLDAAGHATGDDSPEILAALERVDDAVGRVVAATRRAGTYSSTAFVLVGDHGMTSYDQVNLPQVLDALRTEGFTPELVGSGRRPAPETDVVIASGGLASIHLVGDLAGDPDALARVRRTLEGVEGIAATLDEAQQRSLRMAPQYGDLVVESADGWAMFAADAPYTRGRHGSRAELSVAFLLAGAGVIRRAEPQGPRHVDIAPTISALLGTTPPAAAQGRVLEEVLLRH